MPFLGVEMWQAFEQGSGASGMPVVM